MSISLLGKFDQNLLYIVSVSGGIDSMVLLDLLSNQNLNLIVVNFNHLQRSESWQDYILIKNYCFKKKIPVIYIEFVKIKKNFQNSARNFRKKKLLEIASQHKTNYILTAHHLDDLAENIFMKIIRGSSLMGYSGGMEFSKQIGDFYFLKPLLYTTKKKIINYAENYNVPYLNDQTNFLNIYERNKIRNQLLLYFKQDNNFLKHIKHFHLQLLETAEFIREKTKSFLYSQNLSNFNLNNFLNLSLVIQKDVILYLLEIKNISKNFTLIQSIISGLNNNKRPNLFWDLSNGLQLIKNYDQFFFLEKEKKLSLKSTKPLLYVLLSKKLINFNYNFICRINYDQLSFPFNLRYRKSGDFLKFPFGKKKLKSFLIDQKISLLQRNRLWLIVDNKDNIICIPKLYINQCLGNKYHSYIVLINDY